MKLLISGEGPSDLGACNNAQGQCADENFNRGPMAVWLARLWETLLNYNLLDTPEAVRYVSKQVLAKMGKETVKRMQKQRSKKQESETGLYFSNALHLGLMAQQLAVEQGDVVMAVLFHDSDGTNSAPGQMWQAKWDSMVNGFASASFDFGVPMLPKPKSEAWLLCAGQTAMHSHAALEDISGNDDSPKSAKDRWEEFMGSSQNAALEADWCASNPTEWTNLLTMPSFKAFYDRFHEVASAIVRPGRAAV